MDSTMSHIAVTETWQTAPDWALGQRRLFAALDEAWRTFSVTFAEPDGRLRFSGRLGGLPDDRDGVDDFYEPFFNWPLLYMLGGSSDLLEVSKWHWTGTTAHLAEMGMLTREYDRGYDWFHQGEGLLFFFGICLADPDDDAFRARVVRFAGLYTDPRNGNYDPAHRIIRAPQSGADGPREGLNGSGVFPWSPVLARYGLPLEWVAPGTTIDDLMNDPAKARTYADEMARRMGRGDVAVNLVATSLATTAYLVTGDPHYRDWVLEYAGAWRDRALGGTLPDNVGPDGTVGELLGGRWYGGHYGWTWPHGINSVGTAAVVATQNAVLIGGGTSFQELGRTPLRMAVDQARVAIPAEQAMSFPERWKERLGPRWVEPTLLVPLRHGEHGWFDFQPMRTALSFGMWHLTGDERDRLQLDDLEAGSSYPWTDVDVFRSKEEAGHEEPWLVYLDGRNPDYPRRVLDAALAVVADRLARIRASSGEVGADFNLWQQLSPVVTEALMQLTWGAPQVLYNGGLPQARVRYFDPAARRPGLPPGVAALVTSIDPDRFRVEIVNTEQTARSVVVQAGAFAQHAVREAAVNGSAVPHGRSELWLDLPGRGVAVLELRLDLNANPPTAASPFSRPDRLTRQEGVTHG
ncbi:hypothetical protein [Protaetiibacter mangrovi]|uniref:Linalool dehydratase/isomerase domain-containing protein n=1 Tax=Protaetiibacter mangrovi TaxID=2970926 RepID=A0ABT1ZHB3_9MICO|nr:hypothetical protein [Protaetiibacter mangrovi]MCS0500094.1 hypothetical protein [Protaetiibacter mangrovi]